MWILVNNFEKNSISFQICKISISVDIYEKISIFVQNYENIDFGQHFGKKSISVQNFENLDFGQHFRTNFYFSSKYRKSRFRSVNIFEKNSISVKNFENLDFGQHFLKKKLDFCSKFRKPRLRSTFTKKNRFWWKISKMWILVKNFEKI